MGKPISINKVVSRSFVTDIYSEMQNLFGSNLTKYEQMLDKATADVWKQVGGRKMKWYRLEISQLTNGAMAIMFYGEEDD